jgi:hypothetical protein
VILNKIIVVTLVILFGCGKMQEIKLKSNSNSNSNSNDALSADSDVKIVEVVEGVAYKGDSSTEHYIEYAQAQYRISALSSPAMETFNALPLKARTNVYFKGTFSKEPIEEGSTILKTR